MDDYPYWSQPSLAEQLWIAAFEAEQVPLPWPLVTSLREAAELLEELNPAKGLPLTTSTP